MSVHRVQVNEFFFQNFFFYLLIKTSSFWLVSSSIASFSQFCFFSLFFQLSFSILLSKNRYICNCLKQEGGCFGYDREPSFDLLLLIFFFFILYCHWQCFVLFFFSNKSLQVLQLIINFFFKLCTFWCKCLKFLMLLKNNFVSSAASLGFKSQTSSFVTLSF